MNRHEATGENARTTDGEVGTDEAKGADLDRDAAGTVQRIADFDQRAQPVGCAIEPVDAQRALEAGELVNGAHFRTATRHINAAGNRTDVEAFDRCLNRL